MLTTVIGMILNLLPGLLKSAGVISPNMADLIGKLGAAVPTLITSLATGQDVPDDVFAVLTAFRSEIKALRENTNLSAEDLEIADGLDEALADALAAWELAGKETDPSTLTPLPTNL